MKKPSSIADMEFLVNFALEVLHGCKWNCAGCNIDKNGQNGFLEGDFDRLMGLFHDLRQNNYILSNLALGPTDFMTSDNTMEMIKQIEPMFDMFSAITLPTSFLEKPHEIDRWAALLAPYLTGREVKFAVPLDPKNYKNEKMFRVILGNRDRFVNAIPGMKYTKTYLLANLLEYRAYNRDPFNLDKITFEEYHDILHERSDGCHLDVIITAGRSSLKDLNNRERLKSILKYHNDIFDNAFDTDTSKSVINFSYGKPHEGYDKDYVYRNGRIYDPVFVGEPLTVLEDEYSIGTDVPWTTASLVEFENRDTVASLNYLPQTNECSECQYAHLCTQRGVIKLMETLNIRECFAPKKGMSRVLDYHSNV